MRTDALEARSTVDPQVYAEKVKLGHDVANILRKNVVQAHKIPKPQTEKEVWRMYHLFLSKCHIAEMLSIPGLQLTKDTELGDNESIKAPQPCEPNSRKQEKEASKIGRAHV